LNTKRTVQGIPREHGARFEAPTNLLDPFVVEPEREDPGERNIEKRQDAQRRRLDDMPAEAEEIAGAGTAGIDKGGRAAPLCDQSGINAERGTAPIDMSVQIYEPRHDNQAACIDSLDTVARQVRPDRGNLAIGKGNVGDLVAPVRRIDDPAASEKEIRHWPPRLARQAKPTRGWCGAKAARCARRG